MHKKKASFTTSGGKQISKILFNSQEAMDDEMPAEQSKRR